jgi:hypothetical protein
MENDDVETRSAIVHEDFDRNRVFYSGDAANLSGVVFWQLASARAKPIGLKDDETFVSCLALG